MQHTACVLLVLAAGPGAGAGNDAELALGMMPAYKDTLTEVQIQALARYVSSASQGGR